MQPRHTRHTIGREEGGVLSPSLGVTAVLASVAGTFDESRPWHQAGALWVAAMAALNKTGAAAPGTRLRQELRLLLLHTNPNRKTRDRVSSILRTLSLIEG